MVYNTHQKLSRTHRTGPCSGIWIFDDMEACRTGVLALDSIVFCATCLGFPTSGMSSAFHAGTSGATASSVALSRDLESLHCGNHIYSRCDVVWRLQQGLAPGAVCRKGCPLWAQDKGVDVLPVTSYKRI